MNSARRQRVPYFERPKHPRDWRYWVGGLGRVLIVLGLMMFGFVGYQLWGTGLQTAQAQDDLESEWEQKLAATTSSLPPTTSTTISVPDSVDPAAPTTAAPTTTLPVAPARPAIPSGDPVGRLRIPSIGVDWFVVEGTSHNDLKNGPGHFRESVLPGQLGNAAIAGHRTTYGAPFGDLDGVQIGDRITVETLDGTYTYEVTGSEIVSPDDYAKVVPTLDANLATLTLVTCHPEYTARQRLVVYSVLVPEESGQVFLPPPVTSPPVETTLPGEGSLPAESVPAESIPGATTPEGSPAGTDSAPSTLPAASQAPAEEPIEDAFSQGWFDDSAAWPHVLGWAVALSLVSLGAYFIGRRLRRLWVCFAVGAVPFLIALYFFYENVNRLLPPGL